MKSSVLSDSAMTLLVLLWLAALAQAQTFSTLHNFTGGSDGRYPSVGLIQDLAGHIYGTTAGGGDASSDGVVFKLNTAGMETVLHTFSGNPDGEAPYAPLAWGEAGSLYGVTSYGGTNSNCSGGSGCGTVFKIGAAKKETVLYNFTGGSDGCGPEQDFVRDTSGSVYGTTTGYGCSNNGTIFKVDSTGKFTLLHSFAGSPSDGAHPSGGHLAVDQFGNFYGVTVNGGSANCMGGCGVVYKLSKNGKVTLLYSFKGGSSDGCYPYGRVVEDKFGSFYGTTSQCGSNQYGTIWKLSKTGKETVLHQFAGGGEDGCYPMAGVARDSKGNIYGNAIGCGFDNLGALYELSERGAFSLLHSFNGSDGVAPLGEPLLNAKGTLFGVAVQGGTYGAGTVWEYVP